MLRGTILWVVLVAFVGAGTAYALDPLENAYWRFEEGTPGTNVALGPDSVPDSIHGNHMRTFADFTAPLYTADVPVAVIPQTGAANNLAMRFSPNQDIYTENKPINNQETTAYTLEAAFKPMRLGAYQGIVGEDGEPNDGNLQTLVLKMRGDTNELQIEQFDKDGVARGVRSLQPLEIGQWYYAAVVNDGSTLSLYLDRNDGNGYVLQGTDVVTGGALFEVDAPWTIGRGMFNNDPADWFDGFIDEVRLSNTALAPSQFLFVPEPTSLIVFMLGGLALLKRRRAA